MCSSIPREEDTIFVVEDVDISLIWIHAMVGVRQ